MDISECSHQAAVRLTAGLALIYLAFLSPGLQSIDNNMMLDVAISLVKSHNFSVPATWLPAAILGRGGLYYAPFYPLLSILRLPFVAPALLAAKAAHLPEHYVTAVAILPLSILFAALTSCLVMLLGLRIGGNQKSALAADGRVSFS